MKQLASTLLTLVAITGCSSDADIGIDSQPVTCAAQNTATASGSVRSDIDNQSYTFTDVSASTQTSTTELPVLISNNQLRLALSFCGRGAPGAIELGEHDVTGVTAQRSCPSPTVNASMGGTVLEFRDAESGVVIVDQASDCLAGRYAVDFGDHGSVAGTFSVAWPQ